MAKLFCNKCLKEQKKALLTYQLRYMKNERWYKPEKDHYCENCKKTFTRLECVEGHFYDTEYEKGGD